MYKIIIWLIIGMTIQGLWMQWRFTGTIWSDTPRTELCQPQTDSAKIYRECIEKTKAMDWCVNMSNYKASN